MYSNFNFFFNFFIFLFLLYIIKYNIHKIYILYIIIEFILCKFYTEPSNIPWIKDRIVVCAGESVDNADL